MNYEEQRGIVSLRNCPAGLNYGGDKMDEKARAGDGRTKKTTTKQMTHDQKTRVKCDSYRRPGVAGLVDGVSPKGPGFDSRSGRQHLQLAKGGPCDSKAYGINIPCLWRKPK